MTREEAIKRIERIKEKYIHGGDEGFIEEHYALPKDGFCHLYEPCKPESEDKK